MHANANHTATLDSRPWYRQFWPWFLIAIPACTVAGCMVTIALAISTSEPVITTDSAAPAVVETDG